ncbi:MAG: hypothetical protein RLZZ444_3520, partial [Pseudomonadota bacterium]
MKQDRVSMTVLLFGLLVASMGQAGEGDALDKAQAERVR